MNESFHRSTSLPAIGIVWFVWFLSHFDILSFCFVFYLENLCQWLNFHSVYVERLCLNAKTEYQKVKKIVPSHKMSKGWGLNLRLCCCYYIKLQTKHNLHLEIWKWDFPGGTWLRICLPMQGTRFRFLVWEDPTCRGATEPVRHNY